jgi:hypothetical protein
MGAHIEGGIDIGIASGQVDARINLISVGEDLSANATWNIDTRPTSCSSSLNFSLVGLGLISSGGGEVDLVATFGVCPFCDHESWRLFGWDPLDSYNFDLVHASAGGQTQLPTQFCTAPLNVNITSPSSPVFSGIPTSLEGTAYSPNNQSYAPCSGFTWLVDGTPVARGCGATYTFPASPAVRTLTLNAEYDITNPFGVIKETGSASKSVTVSALPPGDYIVSTDPPNTFDVKNPFNNKAITIDFGYVGQPITFGGVVMGPPGTTTSWTAQLQNTQTVIPLGTGLNVTWNVPSQGTYTIRMATNDSGGKPFATATMTVTLRAIPR